jgi:hypothetical protein
MSTKPVHPTGTFDNRVSGRREIWYNGKLEVSHSKAFIDGEQLRGYSFVPMHVWGHFPDLLITRDTR